MSIQTLMQIQPYLPESLFNRLVLTAPKAYSLAKRIHHISRQRSVKAAGIAFLITSIAIFILLTKSGNPRDPKNKRTIQQGVQTQLQFPFWVFGWLLPTRSFNP